MTRMIKLFFSRIEPGKEEYALSAHRIAAAFLLFRAFFRFCFDCSLHYFIILIGLEYTNSFFSFYVRRGIRKLFTINGSVRNFPEFMMIAFGKSV